MPLDRGRDGAGDDPGQGRIVELTAGCLARQF
jgi:hypothetical protein